MDGDIDELINDAVESVKFILNSHVLHVIRQLNRSRDYCIDTLSQSDLTRLTQATCSIE